ncbi:MAG: hypothetical protein CSA38_01585 [Flavobacteriales bacterium]|nr:MAG: hypothetical protein CSA38_01585 [Flavobacteriales bacterium]
MRNSIYISLVFVLFCCKNKKTIEYSKFEKELYSKIDSFQCKKNERLTLIRHQKLNGKDFIQVKINYDYDIDSLAYCVEYNNRLIIFYNDDYFNQKIKFDSDKKKVLLQKYKLFDHKQNENILYHNHCEETYEVKDDFLFKIKKNYDLFNYDTSYTSPPP